jgi:hypothetical protein
MKWTVLLAGLLLVAPPAFARDPAPLVTNGKRLAAARHQLKALERDSAPWLRVRPLLRTLVEEDPKNASRYFALSRRKCSHDKTTSPRREAMVISRVALDALRKQGAQAGDLLARLNAGEPVTQGAAPAEAPVLYALLAWVRREISEINGSLDG